MNKLISKVAAGAMASVLAVTAAVPAFAATVADDKTEYVNSIGSVVADADADDVTEGDYGSAGIIGDDSNQTQQTEYGLISSEADDDKRTAGAEYQDFVESTYSHKTDVYATQAEADDVFTPDGTTPDGDDIDPDLLTPIDPDHPEDGYMIDGAILVSVPNKLILSGETGIGTYSVEVKGNIAGDSVVEVTPDASLTMSQEGRSDTITVNTVQAENLFVADPSQSPAKDLADARIAANGVSVYYNFGQDGIARTTGTMTAETLKAGSWHGVTNFNISIYTVNA